MSETHRKRLNEWYDGTLLSRLNDKRTGRIVIISQRLHEDDLVGHVVELDDWEMLRLPAIAEHDEVHEYESISGPRRFARKAGEALHPEREPLEVLDKMRRAVGELIFAAQYQQSPMPLGGGMVKKAWLKWYAPEDLPEEFDSILQSYDTANTPGELSDFSVCTTWGIVNNHIYLLHVFREHLDYPGLKRVVRELAERYRPDVVLIEDRASGTQLIQELIDEGVHAVKRYAPEGDKQMRLYAQTAMIENGFLHLPRQAAWLADYIHELITFPNSKHDDQVDSTSQALDWIKHFSRPDPVWTYINREMTRDAHRAGKTAEAIAGNLKIPLREVKKWIAEEQQNPPLQTGLVALEQLEVKFRKLCPACGEYILGDYIPVRRKEYHPGCIQFAK
jgi:predicted phage terminase large subunit-like protein